jgi:hypothetical protein
MTIPAGAVIVCRKALCAGALLQLNFLPITRDAMGIGHARLQSSTQLWISVPVGSTRKFPSYGDTTMLIQTRTARRAGEGRAEEAWTGVGRASGLLKRPVVSPPKHTPEMPQEPLGKACLPQPPAGAIESAWSRFGLPKLLGTLEINRPTFPELLQARSAGRNRQQSQALDKSAVFTSRAMVPVCWVVILYIREGWVPAVLGIKRGL